LLGDLTPHSLGCLITVGRPETGGEGWERIVTHVLGRKDEFPGPREKKGSYRPVGDVDLHRRKGGEGKRGGPKGENESDGKRKPFLVA